MTRMSSRSRIAAAIAAIAVTAACSDRAERSTDAAARDAANAADRAGNAATEAAKDVGAAMSDTARATGDAVMEGGKAADAAVETMDVKLALSADTRVDASHINVDTDHVTKTVTLNGRVPSAEQSRSPRRSRRTRPPATWSATLWSSPRNAGVPTPVSHVRLFNLEQSRNGKRHDEESSGR